MPVVVTVHDLAVLRHPYLFNSWSRHYARRLLPRVLRAATRIVAVSEFTRRELLELLDVPEERIHVVRNGVGAPFHPDGETAPGRFVLGVSTLEPRKNLRRLVEGFQRSRLSGYELLIVGAQGWGHVHASGAGVHLLGEVSDDELARLYRGAACVAYVSLYEGFGLPVVEAMRCGTPVVVSQAAALGEAAGDAAVVGDALDPQSIADGLADAVARRSELGQRGLERSARFSWARAARETAEVYAKAAS